MPRKRLVFALLTLCACPSLETPATDSTTGGTEPTSSPTDPSATTMTSATNTNTTNTSTADTSGTTTETETASDPTTDPSTDTDPTGVGKCSNMDVGLWDDPQSCWNVAVWGP